MYEIKVLCIQWSEYVGAALFFWGGGDTLSLPVLLYTNYMFITIIYRGVWCMGEQWSRSITMCTFRCTEWRLPLNHQWWENSDTWKCIYDDVFVCVDMIKPLLVMQLGLVKWSGVKLGPACRLPLADSEFQDPIQNSRIRFRLSGSDSKNGPIIITTSCGS